MIDPRIDYMSAMKKDNRKHKTAKCSLKDVTFVFHGTSRTPKKLPDFTPARLKQQTLPGV